MNQEKLVSIIVPIFNSEKFIGKCIDSIINQTYKNFELLLINDGSTDNSLAICEEYTDLDKRIKVINIPNSGPSVARNIGLETSKGELIQFVDSDDYLDESMIELMVKSIGDHYEMAMCGYYSIYKDKNTKTISEPGVFKLDNILNKFGLLYEKTLLQYLWNKIYLADIIKTNELKFDVESKRGEDLLFNLDYFKLCDTVSIIDIPLYNYIRINDNSLTIKYNKTLFHDQEKVFKKIRQFLNSYNAYSVNQKTIEKAYMERIMGCFVNMFKGEPMLSRAFIKSEIYKIINTDNVRRNLKFLDNKGIKRKILKWMIKSRNINGIYFLFKLKYGNL